VSASIRFRLAHASWALPLAAVAVGLITRLLLFMVADAHPARFLTKDSLEYNALAHHFWPAYVHERHGRLFDLSLRRPPGYPAFIDVDYTTTGSDVAHVILVQVALSVLTIALTYRLAERLVERTAAIASAFVLALDPISITMSSNLTTETLFAALWVIAVLAWVDGVRTGRLRALGAAGALLGVSVLVRPIALYLPVLIVPLTYALTRRRRTGRALAAAVLLLAFAVPVGLWTARNAGETGVATVSTIQGNNLLDYRAADALAIDSGTSRQAADRILHADVAKRLTPGENVARVSQVETSVALHTLLHHPKGAAISAAEGFGRVLFGPGRAELLRLVRGATSARGLADRALLVVEGGLLFVTLALAVVGVVFLARRRRWLPLAATVTLALYDVVLAAGPEGDARLRTPAMPFLAVLAGTGVAALLRVRRTGARAASADGGGASSARAG
jgi:4-amino-4-deoxy-L-arabinose transferase-like glycosyltransferase